MSAKNRIFQFAAVAPIVLIVAACSDRPAAKTETSSASVRTITGGSAVPADLKITSWGLDNTKAGMVFNKQPDGSAALWIRVNQPLTGDVVAIEFNSVLLQGAITGNLVTASVPADLYAKPGSYTVAVIAHKGNRPVQSNEVTFVVQ